MQIAPLCLSGTKVVDLTQVIAGPYAAMQLAILGADVLKIETPGGDPMRWRGGNDAALAREGLSTHYQAHAAGRRVRYLDWTSAEGVAALKEEIRDADVFLCNLRAHVLPNSGLDYDALVREFPRLIVCRLSGYAGDECATWPAYDNTIQAASGLMRLTGSEPEGARVGAPIVDYAAGMASLSAILAALFERERSGRGQIVEVNMLAVAHQMMTAQRIDMQRTGKEPVHNGNRANSGEPLSMVFETAKGFLALAINEEHQFAKFAAAIDRPGLPLEVRFATRDQRRLNAEALQAIVQEALRTRSALVWEATLNRMGVAAAAVRTLAESLAHPGAQREPMLFKLERGALSPNVLTAPLPYAKTPTTARTASTLSKVRRAAIAPSAAIAQSVATSNATSIANDSKGMTKGEL